MRQFLNSKKIKSSLKSIKSFYKYFANRIVWILFRLIEVLCKNVVYSGKV